MILYEALRFLHVVGTAVLLGTGAGIAFFLAIAHRSGEAASVATVTRIVVIADFLFTATAVVAQPVTGVLLAWWLGLSLLQGWVALSILLYLFAGAFWLPVVFMQIACAISLPKRCAREGRFPPNIAGSIGGGSPSASRHLSRSWPSSGS
jgi:uncharacterized membrane protein